MLETICATVSSVTMLVVINGLVMVAVGGGAVLNNAFVNGDPDVVVVVDCIFPFASVVFLPRIGKLFNPSNRLNVDNDSDEVSVWAIPGVGEEDVDEVQ